MKTKGSYFKVIDCKDKSWGVYKIKGQSVYADLITEKKTINTGEWYSTIASSVLKQADGFIVDGYKIKSLSESEVFLLKL